MKVKDTKKHMLALSMLVISAGSLFAGGFPIHGEWCGPGHPKDLETRLESEDALPDAIDEIDSACRAHDIAYVNQQPWGNSKADSDLAKSMVHILRQKSDELTEEQYIVAIAILTYMNVQMHVTLYSDVINGRLSSILKTVTSAATTLTVPVTLTNTLMSRLAEELGWPTAEMVEPIIFSGELAVSFVIEVGSITERAFDEMGDVAEVVVNKIGEETGLDKPVREAKEEIILVLTHPKKAVKKLGQKIIDRARLF